jgi:tetratricopeptide (TPR) repeat protein
MDSLEFSILRPWWLLFLLLPLLFVYIDFGKHYKLQNFIREDIINFLMPKKNKKKDDIDDNLENTGKEPTRITEEETKALVAKPKLWKKYGWLLLPYFCAVFALSGPAITQEKSLFQSDENWIWVLDNSYSMLADDLTPNRYQRVKNSLIELLNASKTHRRIGLIAYAGDNYLITPPTDDVSTLLFNLNEIDPTIMPIPGSEPLPALERAQKILENHKDLPGNILLILDDIKDNIEAEKIINFINQCPYPVYIYAIGTSKGTPIVINNEVLRTTNSDGSSEVVMSTSHLDLIQKVAQETNTKVFFEVESDGQAPRLVQIYEYEHPKYYKTDKSKYLKKDIGYWFLLGSLISVIGFLRNYFFMFMLMFSISATTLLSPKDALANESTSTESTTKAINPEDLDPENSPKEYGYYLYTQGKFEEALKYFSDEPLWRANTLFKLGRYTEAIIEYQSLGDIALAKYNIGNCYAHLYSENTPNALDNALLAYDQALKLDPNHANANQNKTIILNYLEKINTNKQRTITVIDESSGKKLIFNEDDILVTPEAPVSLMKRRLILQQRKKEVKVNPEQIW